MKRLPELESITTEIALPYDYYKKRERNSHKGTYGKAMIMAGSQHYIGAAYLSGMAAYRSGVGMVTIATPPTVISILASTFHEATWLSLPHEINEVDTLQEKLEQGNYKSLLIGPGIGQHSNTHHFFLSLLENQDKHPLPPCVFDADALNILANVENWWEKLPPETIITPHPTEFARLTGLSTAEIQNNRLELAREHAQKWKCVVVLKGAYTVIAEPDGNAKICPIATSALATAGTGDVLAGIIAGRLAQGETLVGAATIGVWVHAMAGLLASREKGSSTSVIASDLLSTLASVYMMVENGQQLI